jgi:serine O-acetyltransferase
MPNTPKDQILEEILADLLSSYDSTPELVNRSETHLPSRERVTDLTHTLEDILYPGLIHHREQSCGFKYQIGSEVNEAYATLRSLILDCLTYVSSCKHCRCKPISSEISLEAQADDITYRFFKAIPEIRSLLLLDLKAAYQGDPAAKSYAEIILSYPGTRALAIHRMAHVLNNLGVPILPRLMSEFVHNRTGIDIHPAAQIGHSVFIDHGTGVVIGETSIVGNYVKIYQGVTLGALSIPDPDKDAGGKRHPTIEDEVTIYSGASILGGQTAVGARSVIGANVWLTHSVQPDTKVLYVPPDLRFKPMMTEAYMLQYYI